VAISQSDNIAVLPNFSDGFQREEQGSFTADFLIAQLIDFATLSAIRALEHLQLTFSSIPTTVLMQQYRNQRLWR